MQIKSAIVTILLLPTVIAYTIHSFIEYCDFVSVGSSTKGLIPAASVGVNLKKLIIDFMFLFILMFNL